MRIQKARDYDDMSYRAALLLTAQVVQKPDSVIGLATGSTPIGTYGKLIQMNKEGIVSFSEIKTFNLDEYCDIHSEHPESYRSYMYDKFFKFIDVNINNIHLLDGNSPDLDAECRNYDAAIKAVGGIDIQILGIGHDGHIGFNEPDSSFPTCTHVVELTDTTKQANARFFDHDVTMVPEKAITMGIEPIMKSKCILLLSNGKDKTEILMKALNGPVTPKVPASIIQMHNNVDVIYCD